MLIEIFDTDYTKYINLLGTAHFTKRSFLEAINAVKNTKTQDLAIELDIERFNLMNRQCISCPRRENCFSNCEFVAASEALGNTNANIWLIDMSESQMKERMKKLVKLGNFTDQIYISGIREENLHRLWEQGFKNEVIRRFNEKLDEYRRITPSFWRILIKERNVLMSARLAEIISKKLDQNECPNILALVGAAHVNGIEELLKNPILIQKNLKKLDLPYSPPNHIRRIQIKN